MLLDRILVFLRQPAVQLDWVEKWKTLQIDWVVLLGECNQIHQSIPREPPLSVPLETVAPIPLHVVCKHVTFAAIVRRREQ